MTQILLRQVLEGLEGYRSWRCRISLHNNMAIRLVVVVAYLTEQSPTISDGLGSKPVMDNFIESVFAVNGFYKL